MINRIMRFLTLFPIIKLFGYFIYIVLFLFYMGKNVKLFSAFIIKVHYPPPPPQPQIIL